MNLLDSIFSGVKIFVAEVITVARESVRAVLEEIDRSSFGKAATQFVQGLNRKYFNEAENLADEERELTKKFQSDGKHSLSDKDRLQEIQSERVLLRKNLEAAKTKEAVEEFRAEQDRVIVAQMTDDELSAATGVLASKKCSNCGGIMSISQVGGRNTKTNKRTFYWQCTGVNSFLCPTIKLNPKELRSTVLRKENPDLDGDASARRQIWTNDDVVNKTHGRLRQSLGEKDEEVICPHHVLPMKLMQKRSADGRMLSSYEYVCIGIQPNGRACSFTQSLETFPQVSAMLRRRDGHGIIDG